MLRGPVDTMAQWRDQLTSGYRPWLNVYCLPYDIEGATPDYLPGLVSTATRSVVTAFVFSDWRPPQPIGDLAEWSRLSVSPNPRLCHSRSDQAPEQL